MQIAVLTFDGFNELDSIVAAAIINRLRDKGWNAYITAPSERVTSMNGLAIERQRPLEFVADADAVIIGSGIRTREIAADADMMARLRLDPQRQLIAAQCSGTLLAAKLGLLKGVPACTDLTTRPWAVQAGIDVIDAPFFASGNVATAGGCLASIYLATWLLLRGAGRQETEAALYYVAPVAEKQLWIDRAFGVVLPFLASPARSSDFEDMKQTAVLQ